MTYLSWPSVWELARSCKAFYIVYHDHELQILVVNRPPRFLEFRYPLCEDRTRWARAVMLFGCLEILFLSKLEARIRLLRVQAIQQSRKGTDEAFRSWKLIQVPFGL